MTTKYLRPADGRRVPMPDGRPWPAEGAEVEVDTYVRRRLADGDLVKASPPKPEKQTGADKPAAGGKGE